MDMGTRMTVAQVMDGVEHLSRKKVAGNTVEYHRANGDRVVRFYKTDILTFSADGAIVFDTGGWKTKTTKERINRFLPTGLMLYSDRGTWYLYQGAGYPSKTASGSRHVYADGIKVSGDGGVTGTGSEKKQNAMKKLIARYCEKIKKLESLPMPDSGDCWYCCMKTADGKTLGESVENSHIIEHVKESYVHGSLILNAMKSRETSEFVISSAFHRGDFRDWVIRDVRSYLKRNLGLA